MRIKIAVATVLTLFVSLSPVMALTRSDIREQVRYFINDATSTTTNTRWTDDVLNKRINIVQTDSAIWTRCLMGRVLITPVAEVSEYRMPDDLVTVDRVSYLSVTGSTISYRKLEWTTMSKMDIDKTNWEYVSASVPQWYYERRNLIGLHPKPSAAYCQARALKIDYYKVPDALDEDTDEPWDADYSLRGYHYLIVTGVVAMCKKDEGILNEYQAYQNEYMAQLSLMKEYINTKPDRGVQQIKITK